AGCKQRGRQVKRRSVLQRFEERFALEGHAPACPRRMPPGASAGTRERAPPALPRSPGGIAYVLHRFETASSRLSTVCATTAQTACSRASKAPLLLAAPTERSLGAAPGSEAKRPRWRSSRPLSKTSSSPEG